MLRVRVPSPAFRFEWQLHTLPFNTASLDARSSGAGVLHDPCRLNCSGPAVDPKTGDPVEAWHIPYGQDPRGISWRDGVVYIADGREPYHYPQIDAGLAPGIRVLPFVLDDPTKVRLADLPRRKLVKH